MKPCPGCRLVRYAGDRIRFRISAPQGGMSGWKAFLRTNLTRAAKAREEIIALSGAAPSEFKTFAGASWRDIPMHPVAEGWELDLPLTEVGYFRAKAYAINSEGRQFWPEGPDAGVSVHPDHLRTNNTIYCAFPRMFGEARTARTTRIPALEEQIVHLDEKGFAVIPPSGKLRDLTAQVPHILETLGCRIVHLLPIGPTPTTYARMGTFGSPYASLDLTGIDPALVDFDQKTTAVDQFRELAYAVHLRGGMLFLDIVVNHTGWGSRLQNEHPDWFKRNPDGTFQSPGAWGVVWGDLVELDNHCPELWDTTADALITWCRRGVDGFRCDAGYMVPLPAWQYIIARVRHEFPNCVFLLEGLGGAWEATETLLTDGGMQWAYSELFQNYSPQEVSSYLDHFIRQGKRVGPLVHYSETHDNDRLAKRGATWSRLRNYLCALTSECGAFGFTGGVEWLATEKIEVHQARGMAWGSEPNLVPDLARLNRLLKNHPCFFDGAKLERISAADSKILALRRSSWDERDHCLVLVNLDPEGRANLELPKSLVQELGPSPVDLLEQELPPMHTTAQGTRILDLGPGEVCVLAAGHGPKGLAGDPYRNRRAQAAWAYRHLSQALPVEALGPIDWQEMGALVAKDPEAFLACLRRLKPEDTRRDLRTALLKALKQEAYAPVVNWSHQDIHRVVPVPPDHWLLIRDEYPFEVTLRRGSRKPLHLRSCPVESGHMAAIFPAEMAVEGDAALDAELFFERFSEAGRPETGRLRILSRTPHFVPAAESGLALLTNGRGGMARMHADLGDIRSKYDCLLGANLHATAPCDRHVLAKRVRAWAIADGFLKPLDGDSLVRFEAGPPASWVFVSSAGDGRTVEISLTADMLPDRNTTVLRFTRHEGPPRLGRDLPEGCQVQLVVRVDLEDRNFHSETKACHEADQHFLKSISTTDDRPGFRFAPAPDRHVSCWSSAGTYHSVAEWSLDLPHTVEGTRGMQDRGDAWSPGWFEFDLERGESVTLVLCADPEEPPAEQIAHFAEHRRRILSQPRKHLPRNDSFGRQLLAASSAFLAHRDGGSTVIAGYPWFLDWGRDTLIAARGLLTAGMGEEVRRLLLTYGRLEHRGTLPNMLSAESTANRDTSDAPLWFCLACQEAVEALGPELYAQPVDEGRSLRDVLVSIARNYLEGTPNGIQVDHGSGLVWSPSHFTWMDTNYPAGTPREGYPVEIQALWIRLLRQLQPLDPEGPWAALADQATASLEHFWWPERDCFHDLLSAPAGKPAALAVPDGHLRPNQLFLISLGLVSGSRARRAVKTVARYLLIPGGMRSLAPLPVGLPLPIRGGGGHLLNDPAHPYWGHYEGDEDTRRKPAYHNGTAWVWVLPTFCEALAQAWEHQPDAVAAARAYLGSLDRLLQEGCLGQLPEILDGDAPHTQRGCDAQAWSATEALRVWLRLEPSPPAP
jgi:starch synthase (maltosyl-transferring)